MLNDNIKDLAYTIEVIKEGISNRIGQVESLMIEEGKNREVLKKKIQRNFQQVTGKLDDEVTKLGNGVQNMENHLKQMVLDLQGRMDKIKD